MIDLKKIKNTVKKIRVNIATLQEDKACLFGIILNILVLLYVLSTFSYSLNILINSNKTFVVLFVSSFLLLKILFALLLVLNTLRLYYRGMRKESRSKNESYDLFKINTLIIIMNYLPEEQKRVLSDLRKRWRSCSNYEFVILVKTVDFWFRHCWSNAWYEITRKIKKTLPNRRI
jgi:hypothetical protein